MNNFFDPQPQLDGKNILVTGGTGSFGKAFVETVLTSFKPKKVIIFSRDELKQYELAHKFPHERFPQLRFFIGDIRDLPRLEMAMRDVEIVIHSAALKHVPAAEYNPFECIHTNVLGAENIVQAAIRADVDKVIALSTDKATNPTNLYGASKLAADKIFIAANNLSGTDGTRFSVVRYGNVIGSRGSIVPFFAKLVREKADTIPITDSRMTRFWITLEQGVNFVLSSLAIMQRGEIFVPKIPSMNIGQLANAIAPDIKQKVVGIRPGEKLHEVLISKEDARTTLEIDDRYIVHSAFNTWTPESERPGTPVDPEFVYESDTNPEQFDDAELKEILSDITLSNDD